MSAPLLEDAGGGRFRLAGVLDFSTVDRALRDRGLAAFGRGRGLILDLAGVTRANRAGMALSDEAILAVTIAGDYSPTILADGPVHYYRFEETRLLDPLRPARGTALVGPVGTRR